MATQPPTGSGRKPIKSQKLSRTLKELESAFTDWESLSSTATRAAIVEEDQRKAKESTSSNENNEEFRKKTKKLLSQLREQLADLND